MAPTAPTPGSPNQEPGPLAALRGTAGDRVGGDSVDVVPGDTHKGRSLRRAHQSGGQQIYDPGHAAEVAWILSDEDLDELE